MAYDLKFLESVNGLLSGTTWPNPDFVEGTYALIQRIHKCLLTNPGEDQFDPGYGSGLRRDILGIAGQQLERARSVVIASLQKVKGDLTDPTLIDPAERLVDLQLTKMEYDPLMTAWHIHVDVVTDAGTFPLAVGV